MLVASGLFVAGPAMAQPAPAPSSDIATRSQLEMVFDRLEGPGLLVVIVAALVIALLLWRVIAAIRRERPVTPPSRPPRVEPPETAAGPATVTGSTDWGHDLNKRSAVTRRPGVAVRGAEPAKLDGATTHWPPVERTVLVRAPVSEPAGVAADGTASPYRTGFNPYYSGETVDHRIVVEEVADTVTQAELLVQLGDPKEAMNLLSRHIRETEKPGPEVWLMLLDLYQATGRESQYNALADGFRALFNAEVPPWATSRDVATRDLETYVQVMRKLYSTWPRADCRGYLNDLLTDNRGGSRQGFSLSSYRELLFLVKMIDTLDQMSLDEEEAPGFER